MVGGMPEAITHFAERVEVHEVREIHREIIDEHNTSVGIVIGAIIIGMSLIISAAVVG